VGLLACTVSLPAPSHGDPLANVAPAPHAVAAVPDAGRQLRAAPEDSIVTQADPLDAQTYLLELARSGRTLYVHYARSTSCTAVELHPSTPDGSAGEILLGHRKGSYTVRQGHVVVSRGGGKDFLLDEGWRLHGAAHNGVLISGALFSTSAGACEADRSHRPLAFREDRCGSAPELNPKPSAEADDIPWVFNHKGMLSPCDEAGAYFSNGVRYPFELFVPLGQAWITGPLAGGSGQPRLVEYRVESGHLRLGDRVLERMPVVLSSPPSNAEPALVETGAHDFARDFLADTRTLHIPLLREGGTACAAVDLSKLHGEIRVPTYSGHTRKLEYVKDEIGINIWPGRFEKGFDDGRLGVTVAVCDMWPEHLSVHGRDADSYHVNGSRWFFDAEQCERQSAHVLPSLARLVNFGGGVCAHNDPTLDARPAVYMGTDTYYVQPGGVESCVRIQVVVPDRSWPFPGYVRVPGVLTDPERETFMYDNVANGRFLWQHSSDPLYGELFEIKPFARGVQIGGARWYRDASSCRKTQPR